MQTKLNRRQQLMLENLNSLPARCRHQGRPGAPILLRALECYDYRTIQALTNRGYFTWSEYGLKPAC